MGADHDFAVSVENYLKTLWTLEQRFDRPVSNRDLAASLEISRPSVSQMIKKLQVLGLVLRASDSERGYFLSSEGRRRALKLLRAHRLVEMFLRQSLGLQGVLLHQEAERLEHAVSETLIDAIDRYLGFPAKDFAGAPIPRADKKGGEIRTFSDNRDHESLLSTVSEGRFRVLRIHDDSSKVLEFLDSEGIRVGAFLDVTPLDGKRVRICCGSQSVTLSGRDAASVEVGAV